MDGQDERDEAVAIDAASAVGESQAIEEFVRTATRIVLGSAGLAVASATRWRRGSEGDGSPSAGDAASNLASAALGLGLRAEKIFVKGASAAGSTAALVTWGVVNATPLRGPVERLAEQFRSERRLSEREVSEAVTALLEAISEAVLVRVDLDRVIDRIALERVLARVDRRELADRIRSVDLPVGG
jgi:hypothetical protein